MLDDFNKVLEALRAKAGNTAEQGRFFERLVQFWLRHDAIYKDRFAKVFLWAEWRESRGEPKDDTGIDLVAEEPDGDRTNYWAIQAKFYAPGTSIQRGDIDTFFTASGKRPFTHRMIVATTEKWGKNAEDAMRGQKVPCVRVGRGDMAAGDAPWASFLNPKIKTPAQKKKPMPHQREAIKDVLAGLEKAGRGRLIMACGTGKTYTALKIAEAVAAPGGGGVLFLVPSLSLLSQALREFSEEAEVPQRNFVVCSDDKVGRDNEDIQMHDLALPATTNPGELARRLKARFAPGAERLNIVFSTYHSIDVVARAQKQSGVLPFDLAVCDEAHRTTGIERPEGEGGEGVAKYFTAIHNAGYILAKKRLYMTATPRLYLESAKKKAAENKITVYSMDDEEKYGAELHRLGFSEAVRRGLLSDYKVMVLTIDESRMARAVQSSLADGGELKLKDAAKLVGCWNGLAKRLTPEEEAPNADPAPMRRAVAFTNRIADSRRVKASFDSIVREYREKSGAAEEGELVCEVEHVDGTMNALQRVNLLDWLRSEPGENRCHILSNARCLSEGVDVPALDAVMFLNPRKSQVDVVQAVGRVMRTAPGKKLGYVILPVVIPAGEPPERALSSGDQNYKIIWDVLRALRAHDERFNAMINRIALNEGAPDDKIQIIGVPFPDSEPSAGKSGQTEPAMPQLPFPEFEEWKNAIFARIVLKCGDRRYWEDWAKDVGEIARTNIARIRGLLHSGSCRAPFGDFLEKLRENLNPAVGESDAVEMLSQHLITRPVFSALFQNYRFAEKNPVSRAMQKMLDILDKAGLKAETEKLAKFYESVRERASGIETAEGKQTVMKELYEKFFAAAFKKDSERLGIVYTPVEIVDFILASADKALRAEFGKGLTARNVHILDPFAGTGTFAARLLQSGIIASRDLPRKYESELHANEIVLLAYYIAAVNIEESFHFRAGGEYRPFAGIVLADTFRMGENTNRAIDQVFPDNSARAKKQNKAEIRVIIGNPPYSAGQRSANDANANLKYPALDARITETYARLSEATNKNSLYDSYIRSIRWAADRIGEEGVVAFVTNGGFIEGNATAGLRKSLIKDFSSIYCLNLRGNARTSGEQRRKEKGNVFGHGTRTPVAVTVFIKKRGAEKAPAKLYYHDIGDYLTREQKLDIVRGKNYADLEWQTVVPNEAGDWINQRHPEFQKFLPLGAKENKGKTAASPSVFLLYSRGAETTRDAWAYNFARKTVAANMRATIGFYNSQIAAYKIAKARKNALPADGFINKDEKQISWNAKLVDNLAKGKEGVFDGDNIRLSLYRPFCRQWLYFDRQFNNRVHLMPRFFPAVKIENRIISVSGIGASSDFSALVTDTLSDIQLQSNGQCFPLYYYETPAGKLAGGGGKRRDNIPDATLQLFRKQYGAGGISKEDIFYYVYGVLHSPQYRGRYASDLKKMLPRIPFAETVRDFRAFAKAGRALAELHVNYEIAPEYPLREIKRDLISKPDYAVRKMRFAKKESGGLDKSAVVYNDSLTLAGIPEKAHCYRVNGKSAVEWVMDRYQRAVNKESGIVNDPNEWSGGPEYIVSLLKRVVRISIETVKIVDALPPLKLPRA